MKKNRYLLCLLLSAFMLYFAVPRLSVSAEGLEGVFAISWLALAVFVIAGNLIGLLYTPKKQVQNLAAEKMKKRSFH
jgi:hypothetical protein